MNAAAPESYYEEARSWDADRYASTRRLARAGWRVAAAGWVCALCCGGALMLLMPLKHVEPFVVRVDNSTGAVDVVPVYAGQDSANEAVTRYFLGHYITTCERFNYATAESDYEECGAFHTARRNQAWYALWNTSNPASPLNVHKDGSSVRVEVQAISFFKRSSGASDLAQVRYSKAVRQSDEAAERITRWIATIQYAYGEPSKEARVRRWNPLGFKIVELASEPEVAASGEIAKP